MMMMNKANPLSRLRYATARDKVESEIGITKIFLL